MTILTNSFLQILNMSYTASLVIVAVLLLRLLLKRSPKVFGYCLWAVVLFRLLCPFSFESALSPLPSAQLIQPQSLTEARPVITSGIAAIDQPVNSYLTSTYFEGITQPVGHTQQVAGVLALLWLAGLLALAGKGACDLYRLRRSLHNAQPLRDFVWQAEGLPTAFVLGLIRPRIFLPAQLSQAEQSYILLHEQTHLRRLDHLWKLLAYAALLLHWFNPLVWLAYRLAMQDMEMSCDEAVLRRLGSGIRADYSASLLRLAAANSGLGAPLAFGEEGVKQRIKNVLSYRRPTLWVSLAALLAVLLGVIWLAANPEAAPLSPQARDQLINEQAQTYMQQQIAAAAEATGLDIAEAQLDNLALVSDFQWPGVDYQVQIWQLDYRLLPADPTSIPLMDYTLDDEGWINWSYNLCQHTLVFADTNGPQLVGELNPLDHNETLPSLENAAHALLEQLGLAKPETFPGEHAIVQFPLSDGEVCQLLLSQPATQGEGGIWCVERWVQGNGNLYLVEPQGEAAPELTLAEYYAQLQAACDEGHQPWRLNPEDVAVDFIRNDLGQITLSSRDELVLIQPASLEDFSQLPDSYYFGYITMFDTANVTGQGNLYFHFDSAELLTEADSPRLAELTLDPAQDLPEGYYIYNPAAYPMYFEADADTTYTYGGQTPKTTTDPAEFAAYLASFPDGSAPPFYVTTHLGVSTEIREFTH